MLSSNTWSDQLQASFEQKLQQTSSKSNNQKTTIFVIVIIVIIIVVPHWITKQPGSENFPSDFHTFRKCEILQGNFSAGKLCGLSTEPRSWVQFLRKKPFLLGFPSLEDNVSNSEERHLPLLSSHPWAE